MLSGEASSKYDVLIAGAGGAGLTAAIRAAERGANVCLIDASDRIGGTLQWANGELSAAATKRQSERGIQDSSEAHFDDVMRLSKDMANPEIVRLAVENAAETVDWLYAKGFDMDPSVPQIIHSHQAYGTPRTYWGTDQARSILIVLERELNEWIERGRVTLLLRTTLQQLVCDGQGRIAGASLRNESGAAQEIAARQVVLATGGCTANPELFAQLHGFEPGMQAYCSTNKGGGLRAALELGAQTCGAEAYTPAFNAVLDGDGPYCELVCRLNTIPEWRQPWEIYVNFSGQRFVREDGDSIDERECALKQQPRMTAWMVFDHQAARLAPSRYRKWYGRYADNPPDDPFNDLFAFTRADTLQELALRAGIDAAGLSQTVAAFNDAACGRSADSLGRQHMPAPINEGPFYAIRFRGCTVFSAAGLIVDSSLRVLGENGTPIAGLFAAGEILGSGQTMGGGNSSGMMATPALTFGRLLGEKILQWDAIDA